MNKKPNHIRDFDTQYQRPITGSHQEQNFSIISEDEIVTLRIAPTDAEADDQQASEFYPYQPVDSEAKQINHQSQQAAEGEANETAGEIELDQLKPDDQLIIETAHSIYHFTVVNPQLLYGKLIGGILGNQAVGATLKFSCSACESPVFTAQRLKLGLSIVFNIEWDNGLRQLLTSTITGLRLRSNPPGKQPAIIKRAKSNSSFITLRLDETEQQGCN